MVRFKTLSLVVAIAFVLVFEDRLSTPACKSVGSSGTNPLRRDPREDNLNVMMVADLLLSEPTFANRFFRDYYMSKFFRKSFETLRPDLLLVLGDVSARGSELTRTKWVSVLRRFYRILGPFVGLPFHAVLGDRDVGECGDIDAERVGWIANKLPGLDSSGCAAFEVGNVSFVTLNAVALLCGDSGLRFEVERVIERKSVELRVGTEGAVRRTNGSAEFGDKDVLSGSGPVVLLHFPLDRTRNGHCGGVGDFERSSKSFVEGLNVLPKSREVIGGGMYDLFHTLPMNASEYILQGLKPRIIFSGHRYAFYEHVHRDRTREITVPAMSWNARDDPGFVVATFQKAGRAVSISYCSLARESHILLVYISIMFLFCLVCLKG
ncbi:Metallophosphoesterase 1 [Spatholobus suberectus]|nr:Metallophosphoesterase 1 [Spatholobus suberectus]